MSFAVSSLPSLPLRTPVRHSRSSCGRRAPAAVSGSSARRAEKEGAEKEEKVGGVESGKLSVLYDDGFGSASVKDYFDAAREIIKDDGGPPRWFCPVECTPSVKDPPLLLFLPDREHDARRARKESSQRSTSGPLDPSQARVKMLHFPCSPILHFSPDKWKTKSGQSKHAHLLQSQSTNQKN